jgi:queuosine precursor transporter
MTKLTSQLKENISFKFSKPQILLTSLFLATNFTYFTMAPRIIRIFSFDEPGGILIFPFTFLFSDILTEVYSYKYTRFLIWCAILTLGIFTLFSWLSMFFPSDIVDYGYVRVFSNYPKLYLGVSIATFLSFFVNNYIISKWKIKWEGKHFWIRSIISTSIGHAIFSITWVTIFHFNELSSMQMIKLITNMYLWKMAFELLTTPAATLISSWLKSKEGDIYDTETNFNPFSLS